MKPASIIFCIISVLVIIAGLFMCTTAMDMAKEQNIALFDTDVKDIDGNTVRSNTVTQKDLNKIQINVMDADVTIAPSKTGETYVELYNFQVGTYDFSVQNKLLQINNSAGLLSILNLENLSFRFNGLRSYLMYRPMQDKQKVVNLYLADVGEVKSIEIASKGGDVFVRDLTLATDYSISSTNGSVWLDRIETTSRVSVSIDKGQLTMNGVKMQSTAILVGEGGCDLYLKSMPKSAEIEVFKGDIHLALDREITEPYILSAKAAKTLYYNGEAQKSNTYTVENEDLTVPKCKATAANGSLYLVTDAEGIAHAFSGSAAKDSVDTAEQTEADTAN